MTRRFVLAIDGLLLGLILLLMAPSLTALPAHEWLGVVLPPVVLGHLLLSWRWIRGATLRLLQSSPRARFNYGLNATLFVLVVLTSMSGVLISRAALPALGAATVYDQAWRDLHHDTLNWLRLAIALHLAMNWEWIAATLRRLGQSGSQLPELSLPGRLLRAAGRGLMISAVAGVIAAAAWLFVGAPTLARGLSGDPISHFAGSPWRGARQLLSQAILITAVAYAGRRWLRVRL